MNVVVGVGYILVGEWSYFFVVYKQLGVFNFDYIVWDIDIMFDVVFLFVDWLVNDFVGFDRLFYWIF